VIVVTELERLPEREVVTIQNNSDGSNNSNQQMHMKQLKILQKVKWSSHYNKPRRPRGGVEV